MKGARYHKLFNDSHMGDNHSPFMATTQLPNLTIQDPISTQHLQATLTYMYCITFLSHMTASGIRPVIHNTTMPREKCFGLLTMLFGSRLEQSIIRRVVHIVHTDCPAFSQWCPVPARCPGFVTRGELFVLFPECFAQDVLYEVCLF